ncbi:MAG: nucleotidyltransferase domain-containing protein [Candidatus Woesearchaeota archaeon]|nr:nucleotidyltransferase domain-containing protein [Nanoarchaeota archaeon]USN44150.1 MAG: nucleotidyltransferase domain-containing protein [Candidatus Woesearchaeota archaeon]
MREIQILQYLISNNSKAFTIREISKNLAISYKIVYEIIQRLKKEDLLHLEKIGNSSLVQFNGHFNHKVYQAERERRDEILNKNKNLKILHKLFEESDTPFLIVLLFGSFAKKTNTKASDIDICILSNDKENNKKISSKIKILPLEIDLNIFTTQEFKGMLEKKSFNVGQEIMKNNIILEGIENYYKLIGKKEITIKQ